MIVFPRMKISPIVWPSRGIGSRRLRIGNHQPFQGRIAHALARLDPCALVQRLLIPLVMPGANGHWAVNFSQAHKRV